MEELILKSSTSPSIPGAHMVEAMFLHNIEFSDTARRQLGTGGVLT